MKSKIPTRSELLNVYSSGLPVEEIARNFKCGRRTLKRWLFEYNITEISYHERRPYPTVSPKQKQLILGSLLGDMSIVPKGPQARLSVTHGLNQYKYLIYKKNILGKLAGGIYNSISKKHVSSNGKVFQESRCKLLQSIVHPYFYELRNKLYPQGNKTVSKWWLDQIDEIGLAFFFMDDGGCNRSGSNLLFEFHTLSFSGKECKTICDWLSTFGLNAYISSWGSVKLRANSSDTFISLVSNHILDCLLYKINGKRAPKRPFIEKCCEETSANNKQSCGRTNSKSENKTHSFRSRVSTSKSDTQLHKRDTSSSGTEGSEAENKTGCDDQKSPSSETTSNTGDLKTDPNPGPGKG